VTVIQYRWQNNGFRKDTKEMRATMTAFIAGRMGDIAVTVMLVDFMVLLKRGQRLIQLRRPGKAAKQKKEHHDFND